MQGIDWFFVFTILFSGLIIFSAYWKKKIELSAVLASVFVGLFALLTVGPYWLYLILAFFVLGNIVTKFKYDVKKEKGVAEKERTFRNVFGNGGAALIFALFFALTKHPVFLMGFLGAMATAAADTFATEIGMVYDIEPRVITTFKRTSVGANGAVSAAGTAAAFLGAATISMVPLLYYTPDFDKNMVFFIGTIAGVIGSFVDSFVGATLEGRIGAIDNHMTNFIATLAGGTVAVILFKLLI
jgi:uncharacterized protein (TIGR00297 family)